VTRRFFVSFGSHKQIIQTTLSKTHFAEWGKTLWFKRD